MTIACLDAYGLVLIGYLEKSKIITDENYAALFEQLKDDRTSRFGQIVFHSYVPASVVLSPRISKVSPNYYFLFLKIKKFHAGRWFSFTEDVKAETNACYREIQK